MTRFCRREKEREIGREKQRGRERDRKNNEILFSFKIIYKPSWSLKLAIFKILKQIIIII